MMTVRSSNLRAGAAVAVLAGISGPTFAQHDHAVVQAGRDAAGQLHMHTHAPMPFEMEPSPFPGISGYATAEVAFESLMEDHPQLGLFLLAPNCDIRAVLVGADPGIQVYDGLDPLPIGGEMVLGAPFFHYLPVWNIYQGVIGEEYSLDFRFRDASGLYADSEVFSMSFTPVPAPPAVAPLLVAPLIARRRR